MPKDPGSATPTAGDRTSTYPVPAGVHRAEQTIRRSRFIGTAGPAADRSTAVTFVKSVRAEFPDATHHCWAYVAGPPGTTAAIGLSDDGEPHGTAGRSILSALLRGGLGDVVAVVTRYYGGTRLGPGGLVRAYGGTARLALEGLPRTVRSSLVRIEVWVPPGAGSVTRRLLATFAAPTRLAGSASRVCFSLAVPADHLHALRAALADATGGQGEIVEGQSVDTGSVQYGV